MKRLKDLSAKDFYPLIRFLGAVGIALVIYRFPLYYMEGALYDGRVRLSLSPEPTGKVVSIAVDSKTLSDLQGEPNTEDHRLLMDQLALENPHAVVVLSNPEKWVGTPDEKTNFAGRASQIINFFFATEQITPQSQSRRLRLNKPFDNLALISAPLTQDKVSFAADKVTRRILISFENQLFLQPILANLYNNIIDPHAYRGSFESDNSVYSYARFRPSGTYKPVSFVDARDGRFPKGTFSNKIVLIGVDSQLDSNDYILTPHSRNPFGMSKLEAQANIIDTLIENNGYIEASTLVDLVITVFLAYMTVLIVWSAVPLAGISLLLGLAVAFSVIAFCIFAGLGIWINMIHPLLAIFVSYYFFIPYRLIAENRKSWEYYQKNRLLTQVEELKTNFLSMMSHDLKTPLARIQGMAELTLNDKKHLTGTQTEALSTIIKSSEELGSFIGSILDLSRIESKEVKLHKTSKDINSILKDVIRKYEFNAQAKNITIESQLDPLFSIKVDVDLIRQVFSNLVENAIKYSPEDSKVVISTKDDGDKIRVEVLNSGPGIPADEVDNVFLKFYRSKAAKASPIKGTGLGLYLAKYFVELHNGAIAVNSNPDQGTRFTVELPVN